MPSSWTKANFLDKPEYKTCGFTISANAFDDPIQREPYLPGNQDANQRHRRAGLDRALDGHSSRNACGNCGFWSWMDGTIRQL